VIHTVVWRRLDAPGHEWSQLRMAPSGPELSGTAVFLHKHEPCRLSYTVHCDEEWATRWAHVSGSVGEVMVDVRVERLHDGSWSINDEIVPAVAGALDVDLAFSPSTNTLPIRRLGLAIGESSEVRATWLTFPEFVLEPLVQRYTRIGPLAWRYESRDGAFVRELTVDDRGLVVEYPGIWEREDATSP